MRSLYSDIAEFHTEILGVEPTTPALPDMQLTLERFRFMLEELNEMVAAQADGDLVGFADALADVVYVAIGTAYLAGIPFDRVWDAVHAANMRKVRGATKRGNAIDARKPEGWVGPEARILEILTYAAPQS